MRRPATRSPKAPATEISLHMSVAAFLRAVWPADLPWTHFPAGEKRDARTGAKLKAMGLAPGWGDFIGVLPNGQLWMWELKIEGGVLSAHQIDIRDHMLRLKVGYAVIRSLDDAQETGARWLSHFPGYALRGRTVERRAA